MRSRASFRCKKHSGRLDVFRLMPPVSAPWPRQYRRSCRVGFVKLDVEDVDIGEFLEQAALPSITLARQRRYCRTETPCHSWPPRVTSRRELRAYRDLRRSPCTAPPRRANTPAPDHAGWSYSWSERRRSSLPTDAGDTRARFHPDDLTQLFPLFEFRTVFCLLTPSLPTRRYFFFGM